MAERYFQAKQFADVAGVTVRTLHHYDRIGLLRPSGRSGSGYRLYGERDFVRLQQIVTLKFIGLPLGEIKDLLERSERNLAATLSLQRSMLVEQRRRLDLAIKAIQEAEHAVATTNDAGWEAFTKVIEVIEMQKDMEWVKKYYTEEQLADLASRNKPGVHEKAQADWKALMADVESSLGEDPAGPKAQELAARWSDLINQFTGGDPGIMQGLKSLYADQGSWPSTFQKPYSDEVGTFIAKAVAARGTK